MEHITLILEKLIAAYPWVAVVIFAVGALRIIMKPLMEFLKALALATPSPGDDLILSNVESSKAYKALVWIVDYAASVKLPKK